jgi:8-oxo-dGTP pyrophosphatase MutT (NUDIX family)
MLFQICYDWIEVIIMNLLKEIIRKQGINLEGKTTYREAVRGIIIADRKLLLIYSHKNGDYKFPGGGVETGESHENTLCREVKEESGATIVEILKGFGQVIEYDKPVEPEFDVFKMTSYYYLCKVDNLLGEQKLDQYEKILGFTPTWVDIDDAIAANKSILSSLQKEIPSWTARETSVLELIKENLFK